MYIFKTKLQKTKYLFISLYLILGLNKNNLKIIFKKIGFSKNLKCFHLTIKHINYLKFTINFLKILITDDIKKLQVLTFKKLQQIDGLKLYKN